MDHLFVTPIGIHKGLWFCGQIPKDDPTILLPLMTGMGYGGLQDSIRTLLFTNVFADISLILFSLKITI